MLARAPQQRPSARRPSWGRGGARRGDTRGTKGKRLVQQKDNSRASDAGADAGQLRRRLPRRSMPGSLLPRRLPPVRLAPLGGKTSRRPAQHRLARAAPYRKPQPLRVRCGHLRCHVCETRGRGRGGAGQGGRRNGGENDAETRTEAGQPTPTPTPRMAWCLLALLALPRLAPRPPRPFPPSPRNRSPGRPFCAGQGFCETRRGMPPRPRGMW